jgi:uncharacterized hydrophobic protein (TIGR00341 family)
MRGKAFLTAMKSLMGREEPVGEPPQEQRSPRKKDDEAAEDHIKEKGEKKTEEVKEGTARSDVKERLESVVVPEERTLKNFLRPRFWVEKREEYRKIKEKEKEDLNVYQMLSESARPSIEYYILTILSCIIATTGLIQGSTAVIIGAMIVAPLMTPILAFSLSVIWGDLQLMKTSLQSIIKGTFWAIVISAIIAYAVPLSGFNYEILSRTKPSLFDILVAIASGLVGAYGTANKKISNSLVGIAIAVALMPPLCTVGIGIGTFNRAVTTGALILYIINLVSISLAGAVVFWVMKIHPIRADQDEVKKRALYQIVLSLAILIGIAIPIGFYMYEGYLISEAQRLITESIEGEFPQASIFSMKTKKHGSLYTICLTLTGHQSPDATKIREMKEMILRNFSNVDEITVEFIPSVQVE